MEVLRIAGGRASGRPCSALDCTCLAVPLPPNVLVLSSYDPALAAFGEVDLVDMCPACLRAERGDSVGYLSELFDWSSLKADKKSMSTLQSTFEFPWDEQSVEGHEEEEVAQGEDEDVDMAEAEGEDAGGAEEAEAEKAEEIPSSVDGLKSGCTVCGGACPMGHL